MIRNAESLAAVHTYIHTHGLTNEKSLVAFLCPLKRETSKVTHSK